MGIESSCVTAKKKKKKRIKVHTHQVDTRRLDSKIGQLADV